MTKPKKVYRVDIHVTATGRDLYYYIPVVRRKPESIKKEAQTHYPLATITVTYKPELTEQDADELNAELIKP